MPFEAFSVGLSDPSASKRDRLLVMEEQSALSITARFTGSHVIFSVGPWCVHTKRRRAQAWHIGFIPSHLTLRFRQVRQDTVVRDAGLLVTFEACFGRRELPIVTEGRNKSNYTEFIGLRWVSWIHVIETTTRKGRRGRKTMPNDEEGESDGVVKSRRAGEGECDSGAIRDKARPLPPDMSCAVIKYCRVTYSYNIYISKSSHSTYHIWSDTV